MMMAPFVAPRCFDSRPDVESGQRIPANIVEGCGRSSRSELARFSDVSIGSSSELEYWLLLTRDLGQITNKDHERLSDGTIEVRKMLFGLRRAIRNGVANRQPKPATAA